MEQLSLKTFEKKDWVGYNDGNIIIIDDIKEVKREHFRQIAVDMFVLVFCLKGEGTIQLNEKSCSIHKNDLIVISPNMIVNNYSISKDFNAKIIGYSVSSIDSEIYLSKNVWRTLYYVGRNPIIPLTDEDIQIIRQYYYIAETKLNSSITIYPKEIMHSLLLCLIYEFLIITSRYISTDNFYQNNEIRQGDVLTQRFIELLTKEKGMIRSVSKAADKLNVSTKYLSSAIKNSSGKNALELIHHYTLQEIIRRLKYTDKSI